MTITGYSNAIVDLMLSWLKGLANWVLRLFNLAGSVGGSPLLWLSQNWLKLLVFLLILGLVLDRLVWLIRWRPYWIWFRKERIIVNDDKFFAHENLEFDEDWDEDDEELRKNWQERDYVVASTVVKRPANDRSRGAVVKGTSGNRHTATGKEVSRKKSAVTSERRSAEQVRGKARPVKGASGKTSRPSQRRQAGKKHPGLRDEDLFGVATNQPDVSDFYEDEVFNVSNLPISDEFQEEWDR